MNKHIRCYHPSINLIHLSDEIYVPEDGVYKYTKELYEMGLGHKATPPQREADLQEFFRWKAKYMSTNWLCKKLINLLM